MSWSIEVNDGDPDGRDLDKAVKAAAEKGILMFCSARDRGFNIQHTYPAKSTNNIFKIGAADDFGDTDKRVGDKSLIDFTFPGSTEDLEGIRSFGSSVATAYASGLAALILYCVQVRLFLKRTDEEKQKVREQFEALKKHDKMDRTFKYTIGVADAGANGNKFVQVWDMFGDVRSKKDKYPDKLLEIIGRVGEKLCARV